MNSRLLRNAILAFGALLVALVVPTLAYAQNGKVFVCDPKIPTNCAAPDSGGTFPVTITFPTIGAPVPATAGYNGINVGGNLLGWTGVNPNGTVYAGQTDVTSVNGVTIAPIEAGKVPVSAGFAQQVEADPTITSANTYAAVKAVGTIQAVTVTANNGQSGFITNVRLWSFSAVAATFDVFLFDANPSASTCTDNSNFVLNTADVSKVIGTGSVTLATPTGLTAFTLGTVDFIPPRPFIAGGATNSGVKTVYLCIVAGASYVAPSNTTDVRARVAVALN